MSKFKEAIKLCPSSRPKKMNKGVVYGIVQGTPEKAEVMYFDKVEPVTEELHELAFPVHPTEIFKIAAPCIKSDCKNWRDDKKCNLAVHASNSGTPHERLPACRIRKECLWWEQEGKNACYRCKTWVTNTKQMLSVNNIS